MYHEKSKEEPAIVSDMQKVNSIFQFSIGINCLTGKKCQVLTGRILVNLFINLYINNQETKETKCSIMAYSSPGFGYMFYE